ncbi:MULTISPECIES: hypothetical protein [unclassified Schaalia]|uniref:hypothetical protein n=1 Tax=unclassified Schaalia TaxID=2691889 RepID=UPI001E52ABAE|nr:MULTISPECIES: hypothetical protein [unclassified Schaalia]MCD4549082.1 hypothetical protein [Schaalia sp. lx-260]MCD4557270.1 hypothetical protein [Schaalia sp. lx-100]
MRGKRFITACVAALCALLAGCGPAHRVSMQEASLRDVVMVVQAGHDSQEKSILPKNVGYLVLVHADGSIQALNVGRMEQGRPLWSDAGVYFGGPENEYLLSDDGVTTLPRGVKESRELSRFLSPDGKGFISFYNSGGTPDGYLQRIVAGDTSGVEVIDIPGAYMVMGQCGDRILAVTDTRLSPQLSAEAARMAKELPNIGSEVPESEKGDKYAVLVQVYPRESTLHPKILAVSVEDTNMNAGALDFPCIGNKLYIPADKDEPLDPNAEKVRQRPLWASLYMQVWDMDTGTRSYMQLHDEEGHNIEIDRDDSGVFEGEQKGNSYTFFARNGQVFTTDLTTGVTHEKPQVPVYKSYFWSEYRVRDGYVYALGPSGEETDGPFTLRRYNVETGESEELLSIPQLNQILSQDMTVYGMAFKPNWPDKN